MTLSSKRQRLGIDRKSLIRAPTMTTFSDFIDNVPATEAIDFYDRETQILMEELGDIDFYRRRELSMLAARRKRKLILDVHWLNLCLAAKDIGHSPTGTWKRCPPE
ncbi:hypothetical protein [Synechococcus sp. MIT S9504]|uniref:hypothetical protein n=2 Tax=unclassified Synechococcus TaxID=2626047 RepID=UPI0012E903E3|nr:hypothetical protein [Synechococcus sp. MIT S9504]